MKEINQKKLLEEIFKIEASANMLAQQCNDLRKQLDETGQVLTAKLSVKKAEELARHQRVQVHKQKVRLNRAARIQNDAKYRQVLPLTKSLTVERKNHKIVLVTKSSIVENQLLNT